MAQILKPLDINKVWASGGDVLTPSDTKIATGWSVEIPPRQYFNYIDQKQDYAIAHINQHGIAVWDSATEYQANKSYTQGPTDGAIYRCLLTHTNQNPETDISDTYWEIAFASAGEFYTKVEADAAYLSKSQNLGDLNNIPTARTNLSVYAKAETYTKAEVDAKTTVSSQAQAEAGVSNTVVMTPLRTAQYVTAYTAAQPGNVGVGQTWQDVTSSRVGGTSYQNTTGKPIMVTVTINNQIRQLEVSTNGTTWVAVSTCAAGAVLPLSTIVPNNHYYRLDQVTSIANWAELR